MTELKERARKQREELEKRMMGDGSDEDDDKEDGDGGQDSGKKKTSNDDSGCSWGMGEPSMLESCSVFNRAHNTFFFFFGFPLYSLFLCNPRRQLKKPFQRRMRTRKTPFQQSSVRTRKPPT